MQTLRQSMSWMHTWTGLLLGWVLYFMFITGSAGYYDVEIDRWMKPELPAAAQTDDTIASLQAGLDFAVATDPDADSYFINSPAARSSSFLNIFIRSTDTEGELQNDSYSKLPDGSDVPEARDTGGGQTLYQMHWAFHYIPRQLGELFAGFAASFMLAAIISGIITHKKIFADFFTLRLGKGQRSWLDSHNVISVMTLPFQFMITFSGIVFVTTLFFLPIFIGHYGYDENTEQVISEEIFGIDQAQERTGVSAPMVPLANLIADYEAQLPNEPIHSVNVTFPNDEAGRITLRGSFEDSVIRAAPSVEFNAATGEMIKVQTRYTGAGLTTMNVLEGLHEGLFAGPALRLLYFISGLMGAGMIATGLVLWTSKRRQKLKAGERAERNLIIIERLNIGIIAGLPVAIAAYFYANRLIPLGMEGRADFEVDILFIAWLVMCVHSLARPPRNGWIEQLSLATIAFATLPILNALTSNIHLGNSLGLAGTETDWFAAGVDIGFIAIAVGLALATYHTAKKPVEKPKRVRKKTPPKPSVDDGVIAEPAE
ncbi:MAG: PepSY-associated TM helix domain-containing protein [Pseudomonadota bacterium]